MSEVFLKKGETMTLVVETLEGHPAVISYDDAYGFALTKINNEFSAAMQKKNQDAQAKAIAEANTAAQAAVPSAAPGNAV